MNNIGPNLLHHGFHVGENVVGPGLKSSLPGLRLVLVAHADNFDTGHGPDRIDVDGTDLAATGDSRAQAVSPGRSWLAAHDRAHSEEAAQRQFSIRLFGLSFSNGDFVSQYGPHPSKKLPGESSNRPCAERPYAP